MVSFAVTLPLELLTIVLSFCGLRIIAVCACVSRQWRRAAAQAVPRDVRLTRSYMDPNEGLEMEILQLLRKPCRLSSVKAMSVAAYSQVCKEFAMGALFARVCAEATALETVSM